ncbi:hypothetical protein DNTS_007174 [Danionella cerebrum]|uniref:Transport and Golgi organization protein 1 homolog n=1 Tax=Danionella cerebrum TaxID=2873325 RepID=A0A553N4S6_9TELE|nr:hypothetical protein DNTS_007174 [Danionella translucida]
MAAPKPGFLPVLTLLLCSCSCSGASGSERRFSELKRCADEECSMLLGRGKAARDFTGPDCRFLSFKKGETVYVYYKLSGRRSDVWAGSVGNNFGYFPKDYLNINHIYTEKELEVPTEETDFVCFDSGRDKFDVYDIDVLLGSALFMEREDPTEASKESVKEAVDSLTLSETDRVEERDSVDSESVLAIETEPGDSESLLQTVDSESKSHFKSDSESSLPLDSPVGDSEPILQRIDSESGLALGSELLSSESTSQRVSLESRSTLKSDYLDLESTLSIESESKESDLRSIHESNYFESESQRVKSEATSPDEPDSLDLESRSTGESVSFDLKSNSQRVDSDAGVPLESTDLFDSESTLPFESESKDSDSEAIPQTVETESRFPDELKSFDSETQRVNSQSRSQHESNASNSDSKSKGVDLVSRSNIESNSFDSESTFPYESEYKDSESSPQRVKSESTSPDSLDPDSLDLESRLSIERADSESISPHESSNFLSEASSESVDSNPVSQTASPESRSTHEPNSFDSKSTVPYESDSINSKSTFKRNDSESNFELESFDSNSTLSLESQGVELESKESDSELISNTMYSESREPLGLLHESESVDSETEDASEKEPLWSKASENDRVQPNTEDSFISKSGDPEDILKGQEQEAETGAESEALDAEEEILHQKASSNVFREEAGQTELIDEEEPFETSEETLEEDALNRSLEGEKSELLQEIFTESHFIDDSDSSETQNEFEDEDETENTPKSKETETKKYEMDEQIQQVKSELINLLEHTLDKEEDVPEEEPEQLLDDENALLSESLKMSDHTRDTPEDPEYSDSVMRLTILRDHLKDEETERMQKHFGLKNMFKMEAMFSDLDLEMKSVRNQKTDLEDIERMLDQIMEASENSILDAAEEIFKEREKKAMESGRLELDVEDVEAVVLEAVQEIIFGLRQKYSTASDSEPLVEDEQDSEAGDEADSEDLNILESKTETEPSESPEMHEEHNESELIVSPELNLTPDLSQSKDLGLEEDGGHFNRNKDAQIAFEDAKDIQKGLQAIPDIGFGFEIEQSGSLESPSVSDFHETEASFDSSGPSTSDELLGFLALLKEGLGVYGEIFVAALPEEWRPGPDFYGVPWEPVVFTVAVGALTVLMFFWRTVLAIKEREEQLKNSKESLSTSQQEVKGLKNHHQKLQGQWEQMTGSLSLLKQKMLETQEENTNLNEKIGKMHQRIEKYQNTLKGFDEERAKVHVLLDEAKLREDALRAQLFSFEKDNTVLKEEKKSLLRDAKDWQERHTTLSEEIRVYHQSRKDLEDALVHKENEIDVLSGCIAELNRLGACDSAELRNEDPAMANGDSTATLSIIEEERNRYMESLLMEQKSRQELEEQYQKVMHDQMNLNNDKLHLENQMRNLQQRLEITTELYQQKENALQQKLTQEELERREKESRLSAVDSEALRSEEELRALRQKIRDIEEEMQQNERSLKSEVAVQEKKAHENWLKARASERALVEERRESATLRQKLVEYRDKITDMEQSVFKINSGPPERHMPPPRRGDSYGPSPVSGGAPSPPMMIEGPGRPPSAPVGRRGEPFGPRPPSDAHGRFSELGNPLPSRPEMFPPMTSSPCAHDGPMLSKSQSQGSFLPSPIRESPVPPPNAPLKPFGVPGMPPNGPPPMMIRPPNGQPPMMPLEPRFRPPHMDSYGPPPPHMGPFGPVPPPFVRGPPLGPLPPHLGPRDVPPDYFGPRGPPPRGFAPGPMIPPPYVGRGYPGPAPVMVQSSRDTDDRETETDTSKMAEP